MILLDQAGRDFPNNRRRSQNETATVPSSRNSSTLFSRTFPLGRNHPLPAIRAIFWDVGGVLLTNAWDRTERTAALEHFRLDEEEFHDRHEMVVSSFERGKITLDEYIDRTVFYRARPFARDAFRDYMFSLSQPFPEVLEFVRALSDSGKYFMGTINNESRELNNYRIEKFGLRKIFRLFVSSCYVGFRKPERDIYRLALETTQIPADQCCFIDDRALNLECAAKLGMPTIEMQQVEQLRGDLAKLGVTP
jgi:putative hydrolase of the HAD superfamily